MADKGYDLRLIVGLGNPGPTYSETRHNAGAWLIEALCQQYRLSLKVEAKFNSQVTEWSFGGKTYTLMIPGTFMNHSGRAIGAFAKYFHIPVESIMVAHDELDFLPGVFRFKSGGGHAGHNGLKDIIHHLNSREFHRIRLGIGHPGSPEAVSDYVLSKPSKEDKQKVKTAIQDAISFLQQAITPTGIKNGV